MLEKESLFLLTHLKDTLEPNHERILEILEEMEELKAKRQIETRVRMINKAFRLFKFKFIQGFISANRTSKRQLLGATLLHISISI